MEEKKAPVTMTTVLGSKGIIDLGEKLSLTKEQIITAKSTALELSSNYALANCNKWSLARYCFETARYNFTRNDCIYPVPYGSNVQAQISYKGFRELCLRAGYKKIDCAIVYSCDKLVRDRETGEIKVEFNEDVTSTLDADVIGYYAYAVDGDGTLTTLFRTKKEMEAHGKKYSKSYDSIWAKEFDKMAQKTVIKQLCSRLRTTPELNAALKTDQIVFGDENTADSYEDNPLNDNVVANIEEKDSDLSSVEELF